VPLIWRVPRPVNRSVPALLIVLLLRLQFVIGRLVFVG